MYLQLSSSSLFIFQSSKVCCGYVTSKVTIQEPSTCWLVCVLYAPMAYAWVVQCLRGALASFCSLLPHRGGRWKVNLFTTSAPGSGDELRLALCLPRAGPGLSHGGQMTAEVKWVLSCSPQQPRHTPLFQSSQAPPG